MLCLPATEAGPPADKCIFGLFSDKSLSRFSQLVVLYLANCNCHQHRELLAAKS